MKARIFSDRVQLLHEESNRYRGVIFGTTHRIEAEAGVWRIVVIDPDSGHAVGFIYANTIERGER